jgi:hypothetical protein
MSHHPLAGKAAGDLTRVCTTHAIGYQVQPSIQLGIIQVSRLPKGDKIFIMLADESGVRTEMGVNLPGFCHA